MIRTIFAISLAAFAAAATSAQPDEIPIIELRKADGAVVARAMLYPSRAGMEVRVQAAGLAPGRYGAHIHEVGRCDGPSFESAGAHLNPAGRQHGLDNPQGHHFGDLPNLQVAEDGHGRIEYAIAGGTLRGADDSAIIDADGAAVVVHAAPDDQRTDPSGNSGARIACGVLR